MKIIIIGRTKTLIDSANLLIQNGHEITGIITSKAAPDYQINEIEYKNYAIRLNVPFLHDSKIKLETFKKKFEKTKADIAISLNYSGIISKDVVDFFPHGILNAHGGDLPRYRGNACQAWAIINGEKKIGICIHKMIGGELDSGDIIVRDYIKISHKTKIKDVYDEFEKIIPNLFLNSIKKLEKDPSYYLEKQSQNPKDILRCYPRKPEDGRIDWELSAVQIHRLIRASSEPYEGAYTFFDSKKIIIWEADLVNENYDWIGIPGQFAEFDNEGNLFVLTGEGKLKLLEIEFDSKRDKPKEFFKSLRSRFESN